MVRLEFDESRFHFFKSAAISTTGRPQPANPPQFESPASPVAALRVALEEFLISKAPKSFTLLCLKAIRPGFVGVEASEPATNEVVEIAAFERILISTAVLPLRADAPLVYVAAAPFIEGEVFVGAQVVNPAFLCPGFLGCGLAVEEPSR